MVKVKICGITNLKDAKDAVQAGCDGLGFVFFKGSPRYIHPLKASQIIKSLPAGIVKIGVFANAREQAVKRIAGLCRLDILQFHGDESPQFCARFQKYKVIKTFRVKNKIDLKEIKRYKVFAFLFDSFLKSKLGGTGKRFNWAFLTSELAGINRPIFLSGGLNERNVSRAIKMVKPQWVDVSSAVEKKPGIKDLRKVRKFIQTAKKGRL